MVCEALQKDRQKNKSADYIFLKKFFEQCSREMKVQFFGIIHH